MDKQSQVIDDLVKANRILAQQGVLDSFGHVSMRSSFHTDRFFLSTNKAPARVEAADIMTLDFNGEAVGDERRSYLERFIHSEIYRARPDVQAVVHSHSPSVIPYSVVPSQPLRPICHVAAGMGQTVPVFDIADTAGPATDMLVRDAGLGKALASVLGSNCTVLMRGHGITIAATSLKAAVFNAIYAELNARLQTQAIGLGPVTYLSEGEVDAAWATSERVLDRAWDNWCAEIRR